MFVSKPGGKITWDFYLTQKEWKLFVRKVAREMQHAAKHGQPILFLCIGTDTVVGDVLGPMVGTKLEKLLGSDLQVWGTLEHPVDAKNIWQKVQELREEFPDAFVVAVDASVGNSKERVGLVTFRKGFLLPGAADGKELPRVGDVSICGIVACCLQEDFQKVRLFDVQIQADFIAEGLYEGYKRVTRSVGLLAV